MRGGYRSDNELFGEAPNPHFHNTGSQTRRESSTRSGRTVERRSKRDETQKRNPSKHKENDNHCRQTSGSFSFLSLSQQLNPFLCAGFQTPLLWLGELRGAPADSSTVDTFLTGLALARLQLCPFPGISFASIPHLFQLQGSHWESLS